MDAAEKLLWKFLNYNCKFLIDSEMFFIRFSQLIKSITFVTKNKLLFVKCHEDHAQNLSWISRYFWQCWSLLGCRCYSLRTRRRSNAKFDELYLFGYDNFYRCLPFMLLFFFYLLKIEQLIRLKFGELYLFGNVPFLSMFAMHVCFYVFQSTKIQIRHLRIKHFVMISS